MKKVFLFLAIFVFYNISYSQSDVCGTATELFCQTGFTSTSGTTTGANDDGGNATPDVFYFYTASADATITVSLKFTTDSTRDTKLVVYSDCTLTTRIAENDDGGDDGGFIPPNLQGEVKFQAKSGVTYYIMVEGADNPTPSAPNVVGDFRIQVLCEAPITPPAIPNGITCTPSASGSSTIFSDNLDDVSQGWTGNIVTSGNTDGSWEIISTGGATSADTGPDTGFGGVGTYMNYEASLAGNNGSTTTASAVSPAIDLSGSITEEAELSFYMHAYGSQMGTLDVGVGNSASGPFTNVFTWSGQLQSVETEPWYQVGVDLSSYLGQTIYIEFAATGTGDFHSDMSIDLVEVSACDAVLDIAEEDILENLLVYPNPTSDILNIKSRESIDMISVYNLLGQEVLSTYPDKREATINISFLPTGMYLVKVKSGNKIATNKIVKQ